MNKNCIITGATNGIGKQTALDLAKLGYSIGLVGRNQEKGDKVLDEIASEVMQLIDGKSSIIAIVDILVKKFEGASKDVVKKDVLSLLQPLAEKGFIVI